MFECCYSDRYPEWNKVMSLVPSNHTLKNLSLSISKCDIK